MTRPLYQIKLIHFLYFYLFFAFACQKKSPVPVDSNQQIQMDTKQIIQEVEAATWALYDADTSLNPDGVIGLLWPECTMLIDGHQINYQDISKGSKQFMNNLSQFNTEWTNLNIIPLAHDAAVSSFTFKDSIIDKAGNLTYAKGPNTLVWQKRNDEWRILYGDADHYKLPLDD